MTTGMRQIRAVRLVVEVLLVAVIAVVVTGVVLGRLLPVLGHQTLVVSGGSMEPAIGLGSVVVLSEVPAESVGVGDVLTLRHPQSGTIITHRVTKVVELPAGLHFQTKGDANADPEGALSPATWMLGRVSFSVPFAGYLLGLMAIPSGIVFILCLAGFLAAALWILDDLEDERARGVLASSASPAAPTPASGEWSGAPVPADTGLTEG